MAAGGFWFCFLVICPKGHEFVMWSPGQQIEVALCAPLEDGLAAAVAVAVLLPSEPLGVPFGGGLHNGSKLPTLA